MKEQEFLDNMKKYDIWERSAREKFLNKNSEYSKVSEHVFDNLFCEIRLVHEKKFDKQFIPYLEIKEEIFENNLMDIIKKNDFIKKIISYDSLLRKKQAEEDLPYCDLDGEEKFVAPPSENQGIKVLEIDLEIARVKKNLDKTTLKMAKKFVILNKELKAYKEKPSLNEIWTSPSEKENIDHRFSIFPQKIFLSEEKRFREISSLEQIGSGQAFLSGHVFFPKPIFNLILEYCYGDCKSIEANAASLLNHYQAFILVWLAKYRKNSRKSSRSRNNLFFIKLLKNFIIILNSYAQDSTAKIDLTWKPQNKLTTPCQQPLETLIYDLSPSFFEDYDYNYIYVSVLLIRFLKVLLVQFLKMGHLYLDKEEFDCAQSLVGDSLVLAGSYYMLYMDKNALDKYKIAYNQFEKESFRGYTPDCSPLIVKLSNNIFRVYAEKLSFQNSNPLKDFIKKFPYLTLQPINLPKVSEEEEKILRYALSICKKESGLDDFNDFDEKKATYRLIKILELLEFKQPSVSVQGSKNYLVLLGQDQTQNLKVFLKRNLEAMDTAEKKHNPLLRKIILDQYLSICQTNPSKIGIFVNHEKLNKKIKNAKELLEHCLHDLNDTYYRERLDNYIKFIKKDPSIYEGRFRAMLDNFVLALKASLPDSYSTPKILYGSPPA